MDSKVCKDLLNRSQDLTSEIQITKLKFRFRLVIYNELELKIENLENWSHSDKSNKSMDLVKSTQSEDLSKDLQGNPRISPQKCEGFHDKMNRIEPPCVTYEN